MYVNMYVYIYQESSTLYDSTFYHGMLQLRLMFSATTEEVGDATRGTLHVATEKAKHLPKVGCNGHTDNYIKLFLLPDKTKKGLRKTQVKNNNLNPIWEEEFTYENVSLGELKTARGLEVYVLKHNMLFQDDVLGFLRLGPSAAVALKPCASMDANSEEAIHWEAMLKDPGKWVEHWHSLRPSRNAVHFSSQDKKQQKGLHGASLPPPSTEKQDPSKGCKLKKNIHVPLCELPSEHVPSAFSRDTSIVNAYVGSALFSQSNKLELRGSVSSLESSLSVEMSASKHNSSTKHVTGYVMLGMAYEEGGLLVEVCKCRDLISTKSKSNINPFIKTYLLPDKGKKSKQKTGVRKKTNNPVYNETMKVCLVIIMPLMWLTVFFFF